MTFAAGAAVLEFACADASARAWVSEFLRPWLPPAPAAAPTHRVSLLFDADAQRALEASRHPDARPLPCFALDGGVIERPAWQTAQGLAVEDADFGCHMVVSDTHTLIVAPPGERRARVTAARVLRELAAAALSPSHLAMHAAAAALDGRALLLAGPRRRGKTSLLVHLLLSTSAAFIANDWVWLRRRDDGRFEALGMPTIVAVRPGTITRFPGLLADQPANGSFLPYTLAEIEAGAAEGARSPRVDALTLSPHQLAARTGATPLRGAPLGAILLPEIDPGARETGVEPVAPDEVEARLRSCAHGVQRDRTTVFGHRATGPPGWHDVAARVPIFRCRLGPEAYRGDGLVRALAQVLA